MIGDMATDALGRGVGDYLMFIGMIATVLAFYEYITDSGLGWWKTSFSGD